MPDRMQQFLEIGHEMPAKRPTDERRHDFLEIYGEYGNIGSRQQASRCEQCGIPFCQIHCPLQNNIPDWLILATEGRLAELEDVISRADVIDPQSISGKIIRFGATVRLADEDTDEISTYQIVGTHESDIAKGKLSITSPLARALIGKTVGDSAEVTTPGGGKSYQIMKVQFK